MFIISFLMQNWLYFLICIKCLKRLIIWNEKIYNIQDHLFLRFSQIFSLTWMSMIGLKLVWRVPIPSFSLPLFGGLGVTEILCAWIMKICSSLASPPTSRVWLKLSPLAFLQSWTAHLLIVLLSGTITITTTSFSM